MKRILIITLLVIGGLLWLQTVRLRGERAERRRVQSNNEVLTDSVEFYRTESGNTPHPGKCSNSGRRRWNATTHN